MINWDNYKPLVKAIARRRSVIVIGSGVSKNSTNSEGKRPSTWEDFLKKSAERVYDPPHIKEKINEKDFLTACELIKKSMGNERFRECVEEEYSTPRYNHASIHEYIYNLDSAIVASPNFDNIYDTYALNASKGTMIIRDHTCQDIIGFLAGGDKRLLIKTHGSATTEGGIIFTRKEYAEARTKYVLFYEILKSLVLTHTFFFIGCGIDDPDIRLLFVDVQFAHNRMPYHYMTIPNGEVHDELLNISSETMKIIFLKYSPDNYHENLTKSLEKLVMEVDLLREEISKNLNW